MRYLIRNDLPKQYFPVIEAIAFAIEEVSSYSVEILDIKTQVQSLEFKGEYPTISLDKHFTGDHNLRLSRLFNSFVDHDPQDKPLRLISSNGVPLNNQIDLITPGKYGLVDDDSASGYTIQKVYAILSKRGVDVVDTVLLNPHKNFVDIIDASDFISPELHGGGLWIQHRNYMKREGYLSPHVNLETRASLSNFHKPFLRQVINSKTSQFHL